MARPSWQTTTAFRISSRYMRRSPVATHRTRRSWPSISCISTARIYGVGCLRTVEPSLPTSFCKPTPSLAAIVRCHRWRREYIWRAACEMGLEGIVSKRRGSRYVSGRFDGWRKTKCSTTEHFAVLGFDRAASIVTARAPRGRRTPPLRLGRLRTERRRRAPDTCRPRRRTCRHRHSRVSRLHPGGRAAPSRDPRVAARLIIQLQRRPPRPVAYFRFIILKNVTVVFSSGPTGAGTA